MLKVPNDGTVGANGLAVAFSKSIENLWAAAVVFHGLRIGLRVRQHLAIGGEESNTNVARRHFRDPVMQSGAILGSGRTGVERGRLRWSRQRDACNGGELFESGALVVAPQSPLGIEIDGEQNRDAQGGKSKTEFPEKVKPHRFQPDTPRPALPPNTSG